MHEEIKLWGKRKVDARISNQSRGSVPCEAIKENGIDLFKQILIKKSKVLGVRKTETVTILKKKTGEGRPRGH